LLEDFENLMEIDNVSKIFARKVLNKTFKCIVTGETKPQSVILKDVDGRNVKDLILAVISDSRPHFNNYEVLQSTPPYPMTATRNIKVNSSFLQHLYVTRLIGIN
jgi:Zn-dependent M32 family carboxypeptidase